MIRNFDANIYRQYMYSYPHKTAYGTLENVMFRDYTKHLMQGENSLYFHIPFCESKCGFCNLFSVTGQGQEKMQKYLFAMKEQARQYEMEDILFQDLTIGGGTPLLLPEKLLEELFQFAKECFLLPAHFPITIETSPSQTTKAKVSLLKKYGVTRVSIGVQSFCEEELHTLRRGHSVAEAKRALDLLKTADFPCLNLDLIYGIEGQTLLSVEQSLKAALAYAPQEIFIYPLYIKPHTVLGMEKAVLPANTYELYCKLRDDLKGAGYTQLSMRRFAKNPSTKDSGCGQENTVSIGCGGRSYLGNLHFCTPYHVKQADCRAGLEDYLHTQDYQKIPHGFLLSEEEQARRYLIKNLLSTNGLFLQEYSTIFQRKATDAFVELMELVEQGYAVCKEDKLILTERGLSFSDAIGPLFISPEVQKKMTLWYQRGH